VNQEIEIKARYCTSEKQVDIINHMLATLKHANDLRLMPHLTNIVKRAKSPVIIGTALECVHILNIYAEKQEAPKVLLRASKGDCKHEELLRATTPLQDSELSDLLIPSSLDVSNSNASTNKCQADIKVSHQTVADHK